MKRSAAPPEKALPAAAPSASADVRALRARAHALKPVVWLGQAGLTPGAIGEVDRALTAHELIKIHVALDGRGARQDLLAALCGQVGALPVQVIGKMLVAFRSRPAAREDEPRAVKARPRTVARRDAKTAGSKRKQEAARPRSGPARRPAVPRRPGKRRTPG